MLNRQKIVLSVVNSFASSFGRPIDRTRLVKFVFLSRQETALRDERTFYDFVPYRFGPFSFALYRETETLVRDGYLEEQGDRLAFRSDMASEAREKAEEISSDVRDSVHEIVSRYGRVSRDALLRDVYARYPGFAVRSELKELLPRTIPSIAAASPAVYTAGYEGNSVDFFFERLLRAGIKCIIDVRANPISMKYGFARKTLSGIASRLGIDYAHRPELGIPSSKRAGLTDFDSYQRLFDDYERTTLPTRIDDIAQVATHMSRQPSVLVCMERDARSCHRSRLANSVARESGLEQIHL